MSTVLVPIELIDPPLKPIRDVDASLVNDLRESIEENGILQNLLLRPKPNGRYEIVFGLQRFYGAKGARLKLVPAQVRELTDRKAIVLALSENIQRQTLDPIREGEVMLDLTEGGKRPLILELSREIGKSRVYIESRIKLVQNLDDELKKEVGKRLTITNALHLANYNKGFQRQIFGQLLFVSKLEPQSRGFGGGLPTEGLTPKYCICPNCGSEHIRGKSYR
jgi:ParB family chromosome partitioning protein